MRHAVLVMFVIVALGGPSACGDDSRPEVGAWSNEWQRTESKVPAADTDPVDLSRRACDELLVAAREARPDLLPSPSPPLDALVDEWIVLAESIGFDCHSHPDLGSALEDLHTLTSRVDERLVILLEG